MPQSKHKIGVGIRALAAKNNVLRQGGRKKDNRREGAGREGIIPYKFNFYGKNPLKFLPIFCDFLTCFCFYFIIY